jgi:hypothetical protein
MNQEKMERFQNCLYRMWNNFSKVAVVDKHQKEIEQFIEADEEAHVLLSDLSEDSHANVQREGVICDDVVV